MQRLPQHVLTRILEYTLTNIGPQPASDFLVVNSAFYVAAIPTLYRSPRLTVNIESFFYHSDIPLPPDIDTLDNAALIQAGHTKLAALRYVRTLFIDFPALYEAEHDDDLQMTEYQKRRQAQDQIQALIFQMDMAEKHLTRMPTGALRSLEKVRTGDAAFVIDTVRGQGGNRKRAVRSKYSANLTHRLLQRSLPEVWCETPRTAIYLSLESTIGLELRVLGVGIVLINHVQPGDIMHLIGSATNYIYIHPWTCPIHAYKSSECSQSDTSECDDLEFSTISLWLEMSIEQFFYKRPESSAEPVDKGRIVIGGLYESVVKSMKGMGAGDEEAEDGMKNTEWYRSLTTTLIRDFQSVVNIEFRKAEDMPPCPGCGALCG